ncbi:MAG: cyclic nucleotide-binding domain-containing protein [Prosthecobacter sp.]|jgi:CRP/FNR family cyclic AMP-dependent transcriptional regulator|uniref:Crp/Fnr family transcriptional regulator n=1 Tax=Prosthecobacter sp. TaxID=1965333 RepID=UPI001A0FD60D|nr:cyclic nucleotide-binding domain-containing protein [Prosthecobacter sp.]MBE2286906.1 cyclic nucleotide-binding domain-containing protein [Prosthecobacter sp.]
MKLPEIFANPVNVRSFAAGTPIFKAGDDSGEMFVVQSGSVDIILNGTVVETVGTDGFFGEISLIEDAPRAADAIAREDCRLLPVNKHHFLYMVDEMPQFALHVMKGMADRLRRADKRAEM